MTRPLDGIRILDLSHVVAGPFCSRTLADLGADVIKIERPGRGEDARALPPFVGGKSAYFAALNHSKRSMALDLKSDPDRAVFERLLPQADVVLEGFRPGVMDRLGYGFDDLHAGYPALIYGAVSGYGNTGPEAKRPSYDSVVQARAGWISVTGLETDVAPPVGDLVAGLFLAQGVLAALFDRARTGLGRKVDISLLDAQAALLDHALAVSATAATSAAPAGLIAPNGCFEAQDGRFVLAVGNDVLFEKLCVALNLPLAEDPRFASNAKRVQNARLLTRLIETITLEQTCAHWIAKLAAAGIPSAPIQTIDQVMNDPQLRARNMIVDVLDRNGRPAFKATGNPIKMSGLSDPSVRNAAPDLDAHRGEILRWLAGGR